MDRRRAWASGSCWCRPPDSAPGRSSPRPSTTRGWTGSACSAGGSSSGPCWPGCGSRPRPGDAVRPAAVAPPARSWPLGLGALYCGNAGTYYAGLETVPAALAGVLVYTYPVIVAVLSLRFATRLPGRRPWFALGLALVGVVLALGGIDGRRGAAGAAASLVICCRRSSTAVWIVLSARLSGERRDRVGSEAPAGGLRGPGRRRHDGRDDDRDRGGVRCDGRRRPGAARSAHHPDCGVAVPDRRSGSSRPSWRSRRCTPARDGSGRRRRRSSARPSRSSSWCCRWFFLDQRLAPIQLLGAGLVLLGGSSSPRPPATAGARPSRRRHSRPRSRAEPG